MAKIETHRLFINQDVSVGDLSFKFETRNYDSMSFLGSATAGTGNLILEQSIDGINFYKTTNVITVSAGQDIFGNFTNDCFFTRIYVDADLSGCTLIASMREHY